MNISLKMLPPCSYSSGSAQSKLRPTALCQPRSSFCRLASSMAGSYRLSVFIRLLTSSWLLQTPAARPASRAAPRAVVSRIMGRRCKNSQKSHSYTVCYPPYFLTSSSHMPPIVSYLAEKGCHTPLCDSLFLFYAKIVFMKVLPFLFTQEFIYLCLSFIQNILESCIHQFFFHLWNYVCRVIDTSHNLALITQPDFTAVC